MDERPMPEGRADTTGVSAGDFAGATVFVSGPMDGYPNFNLDAFVRAQLALRLLDVKEVYNPATRWLEEPECQSRKKLHEHYMLQCLNALTAYEDGPVPRRRCDMLIQLEGWEDSAGALVEHAVAKAVGIPCVPVGDVYSLVGRPGDGGAT